MSSKNKKDKDTDFDIIDNDFDPKEKPENLASTLMDFVYHINIKLLIFLFLIFLFVNSTIFVDRILAKIPGTVDGKIPNNKGVLVQGACLVLLFIIMDLVVKSGVI